MKINIYGNRYFNLEDHTWSSKFSFIALSCLSLGHDVLVDEKISLKGVSSISFEKGLYDNPDISIFNHTHPLALKEEGVEIKGVPFFWKPSGPTSNYYSIDHVGYACHTYTTYEKPPFEGIDTETFFNTEVVDIISNQLSKWKGVPWYEQELHKTTFVPIPANHVLVLGQMPGDETVNKFSFGDHWKKLTSIVDHLIKHGSNPIVVKLHPYLKERSNAELWQSYYNTILHWESQGVTVIYDFTSVHTILPKTKVAILENSTAGLECLVYDVPIICYGYPEYHWVSYNLKHLVELTYAINTVNTWWSKKASREWLTWYCTEYMCKDYDSTLKRLKELFDAVCT